LPRGEGSCTASREQEIAEVGVEQLEALAPALVELA
jgi:hypothetical protein